MSLIARFVFDKGDPVDVRLNPDQKEDFLEHIKNGTFFHDAEGEGVFFANREHLRFFYIAMENVATPPQVTEVPQEKPGADA